MDKQGTGKCSRRPQEIVFIAQGAVVATSITRAAGQKGGLVVLKWGAPDPPVILECELIPVCQPGSPAVSGEDAWKGQTHKGWLPLPDVDHRGLFCFLFLNLSFLIFILKYFIFK